MRVQRKRIVQGTVLYFVVLDQIATQNIVGTASEKVTNGGEFAFVQSMIEESYDLRDRVECFTSMIGIKRNFTAIQQILRLNKVPHI